MSNIIQFPQFNTTAQATQEVSNLGKRHIFVVADKFRVILNDGGARTLSKVYETLEDAIAVRDAYYSNELIAA